MFQLPEPIPRSQAISGHPDSEPAPGILVDCQSARSRDHKPGSRKVKNAPLLSIPVVPPHLASVVPLQPARPRLAKTPAKPFPGNQFAPMVFSGAVSLVFLLGLTLTSLYFCQAHPIEDTNRPTLTGKIPVLEEIRIREPVLPEPVTPPPNPDDPAQIIAPPLSVKKAEPAPPPLVAETVNPATPSLASSVEESKVAKLDPPKEPRVEKKKDPPPPGVCNTSIGDDTYGTAVTFVASPKLAEEQAAQLKKLVFVLHVSGNFEDPGFT